MKAIEQYFHVVLFIMLNKVVLAFTTMDTTVMHDNVVLSIYLLILTKG